MRYATILTYCCLTETTKTWHLARLVTASNLCRFREKSQWLDMKATYGYQLSLDRVDQNYTPENRRLFIWAPLSKALREEELSGTELATTDFVLRTGNATMYLFLYNCHKLHGDSVSSSCHWFKRHIHRKGMMGGNKAWFKGRYAILTWSYLQVLPRGTPRCAIEKHTKVRTFGSFRVYCPFPSSLVYGNFRFAKRIARHNDYLRASTLTTISTET